MVTIRSHFFPGTHSWARGALIRHREEREGFEKLARGEYTVSMSEKNPAHPDRPKNRYYPRLNTEILLAYRPPGGRQDESRIVKTRSIGLGGVMFEADHPLSVGSSFLLDLVLDEKHLTVSAKVVYSNRRTGDSYQIGFSFVGLTADQREQLMNLFLQEYSRVPPDAP
jgi:hypothetical protein